MRKMPTMGKPKNAANTGMSPKLPKSVGKHNVHVDITDNSMVSPFVIKHGGGKKSGIGL